MLFSGSSQIRAALGQVGDLIAYSAEPFGIAILGGAALNLLGLVERPTRDVDILAFARYEGDQRRRLVEPPERMPAPLLAAIDTVRRAMDLEANWLNTGPALQWRAGLPPGLAERVEWQRYLSLDVGLVGRYDLIFFKLFAAADATGPKSVHYRDLIALQPSAEELAAAADWVRTQDASPDFATILQKVVDHVRRDRGFHDADNAEPRG